MNQSAIMQRHQHRYGVGVKKLDALLIVNDVCFVSDPQDNEVLVIRQSIKGCRDSKIITTKSSSKLTGDVKRDADKSRGWILTFLWPGRILGR
jgi:hypothetical protein